MNNQKDTNAKTSKKIYHITIYRNLSGTSSHIPTPHDTKIARGGKTVLSFRSGLLLSIFPTPVNLLWLRLLKQQDVSLNNLRIAL